MGRATEFFDFINQKNIDKERCLLYTHISTDDPEIKRLRREYQQSKKAIAKGLSSQDDGTFNLF